ATITVTQVSDFGCDSTVTNDILILPTPMPVIVGEDSTCQNKIYAYSITPTAGHTYSWSASGGSIIGSNTGDAVNVIWGAPEVASITFTQTSAFGCDSTVTNDILILPGRASCSVGEDSTCHNEIYAYSITPTAGHTYSCSVYVGSVIGANTGDAVHV